ncbi:CHAT domain-containing protein [Microbacterium sp. KUDC0406]|uniref:CHAT domain-containing protein n=1 Tax=Microbacterium sp. KUDC0406 TaxID=2909588 RepID=UPI001F252C97|nr:CHAT domain-containing protein [Microbacterium sp. KUDC0406]UJP09451.1 CHAT domain-containing protein [Microbacterium sp. KUDC0406]
MRLTAAELHARGKDAANHRRFAASRHALLSARERTDDPDLLARISGTLSYVLAQTGEPDAAERMCRDALATAGLSAGTRTVLAGQLGTLLMNSGHADEAERHLSEAVDGMAETPRERASCLMNRSVVRMQRHDLDGAAADLEAAVALCDELGEHEGAAEALHNLGYAALLRGDLVTALALMMRSRPVFVETGELATAIADLDRAEVLREAGLTDEAEALLAEVAVRFGRQRMRQTRGEAEFQLARSQLHHDPAAARRTAGQARRRFDSLGSEGWAARAAAVELEARRLSGRLPSAEEYDRTARRLRTVGLDSEAAAAALGARLADPHRRPPRVPADAPTPVRLRAFEVRAAQALDAGRAGEARRLAAEGLELFTSWQSSFGALDLQASVTMHGAGLLAAGLAAVADVDDPSLLFDWGERARRMGLQVVPVRPPHDPAAAADLAELRMLRTDLSGEDWMRDPRVRAVRDRVRERQWSATAGTGTRQQVSLTDLRSGLDEDVAVLTWVYTGAALRAVVATRSDTTIVRLSWERVQPLLDGMRADLDAVSLAQGTRMVEVVRRSLDDRMSRLDEELLRPLLDHAPGAGRLVLSVPGALTGIPWALLPGLAGRPFTLATSATRWRDATSRPLRRTGAIAGPRVVRAADEVQAVAGAHGDALMLTGEQATVGATAAMAGTVDLLHVAAHGRHSADSPMFSGLELVDGTLFGYDVDLIDTVPDTVVLSACELGRSTVRWREEAIGMTRVWLHAGARCVIASPVLVPDDAAATLLPAVHERIAAGVAPAVALSDAADATGIRVPLHAHGNGF